MPSDKRASTNVWNREKKRRSVMVDYVRKPQKEVQNIVPYSTHRKQFTYSDNHHHHEPPTWFHTAHTNKNTCVQKSLVYSYTCVWNIITAKCRSLHLNSIWTPLFMFRGYVYNHAPNGCNNKMLLLANKKFTFESSKS